MSKIFVIASWLIVKDVLLQVGKVYKVLSQVQFLPGIRELRLLMGRREGLSICTKKFSLLLFIEISDPAMCYCLMILQPKLLIST